MRRGLTTSDLKIAAVITMLVDHVALVLLLPYVRSLPPTETREMLAQLYAICRRVGRLSFPLFIFCLVEGFFHTHDRRRYLVRLAACAAASELPYDLALRIPATAVERGTWYDLGFQNVIFTLAIGFAAMWAVHGLLDDAERTGRKLVPAIAALAVTAAGCLAAHGLRADYSWYGVLAILLCYLAKRFGHERGELPVTVLPLTAMSAIELYALLDLPLVLLYDGEAAPRAWHRWLFYAFYPAHLLLLGLLKLAIFGR